MSIRPLPAMIPTIPGHQVVGVLREVPGRRLVLRTEVQGVACVTRVILDARIDTRHGPLVAEVVLRGRGSLAGMPEAVGLVLEGYRVASRLPRESRWWTHAYAAGVTPDHFAYVSTRWMEGTPLHQISRPLPDERRLPILMGVAFILRELHARQLVYGDLKAENLVLGRDGLPALIDLDTLREVPAETIPAVTRDLTRSWAAPEQHQHHSYLASDIWAFAGLVENLWPEGTPMEWRELLRACRQAEPLRRPHTLGVYELIAGQRAADAGLLDWEGRPTPPAPAGSGHTERVPEAAPSPVRTERMPEAAPPVKGPVSWGDHAEPSADRLDPVGPQVDLRTERVPEGPASLPPWSGATPVMVTPDPVVSRPRIPGCAGLVLGLFVVPLAVCVGGGLWLDRQYVDEANASADAAWSGLRAYKTRPELNRDASQRRALRTQAQAAWETRATPHAGAVYALAMVWEQGWQDAGKSWNDAAGAEARSVLDEIAGSKEPEALLAMATLDGASCRLRQGDATAVGDCARALDTLEVFFERLPDDADHRWLAVEGAWTETLVLIDQAHRARDAGLPEASGWITRGLDRCTSAEPWLEWAPVNGPEMLQDCLLLAAMAPDFTRYFAWSQMLLDKDLADGQLNTDTLRHLYTAAGTGCDTVKVTKGKRGEYFYKGADWCLAVGHGARGARTEAMVIVDRAADPNRPWDMLRVALGEP